VVRGLAREETRMLCRVRGSGERTSELRSHNSARTRSRPSNDTEMPPPPPLALHQLLAEALMAATRSWAVVQAATHGTGSPAPKPGWGSAPSAGLG